MMESFGNIFSKIISAHKNARTPPKAKHFILLMKRGNTRYHHAFETGTELATKCEAVKVNAQSDGITDIALYNLQSKSFVIVLGDELFTSYLKLNFKQ